ncbi:hypothetical protein GCM10007989_17000 [Devosia pacifica]|uniref:Calpastatin n=1 Tax=Devosia pacifica TaxID=1335967 RepID=A0A918S622_9HYPH|nr:DUF1810 domain-containing protein [Devosia pacifica]GHA22215.1 hypothetical protein GCM10007989_17000 [Devosia pacifica]
MFEHFVDAQRDVFPQVLAELRRGQKTSHWMWFVFPQLDGLGSSDMAKRYALKSVHEAAQYLHHPVLGLRLEQATELVEAHAGTLSAYDIFSSPDDMKFHASMTLFAKASPSREIFMTALADFFDGEEHQKTLELLRR